MAARNHLRYVGPDERGFHRQGTPPRFRYLGVNGRPILSAARLARIESLVIPPVWTDVWICKDGRGHLQATGVDARGRKQYLYHSKWRSLQESAKFDKCLRFASKLPRIRLRVSSLLRKRGLPRAKVLAAIVRLLDVTLIRVGNESYSKENGSFGLTTLRDRHAEVDKERISFKFRGKSGVEHETVLEDPRLAKIVRRCQELPGQQLFQYQDESGELHDVKSQDVNQFLHEITKEKITAKDFRTWAATQLIVEALLKLGPPKSDLEAERNICTAIKEVARRLGNTMAVCRKSYIHPAVLDAYRGDAARYWFSKRGKAFGLGTKTDLSKIERHVVRLLQKKQIIRRRAA
jgi:DNA topoisomerase-1